MPGPPTPRDPLSLPYALQVSEMCSESHQFCNIKVSGSGGGRDQNHCPERRTKPLLTGRACWGAQFPCSSSPQPDSQVSDNGNQTPAQPHRAHGGAGWTPLSPDLHVGVLGCSQTRAQSAVCEQCSEQEPLTPGLQPRRQLPAYTGGLRCWGPLLTRPRIPLPPPTPPVCSATSMALMGPPLAGSLPPSMLCSLVQALASRPLPPSCRASYTGGWAGCGPACILGQNPERCPPPHSLVTCLRLPCYLFPFCFSSCSFLGSHPSPSSWSQPSPCHPTLPPCPLNCSLGSWEISYSPQTRTASCPLPSDTRRESTFAPVASTPGWAVVRTRTWNSTR